MSSLTQPFDGIQKNIYIKKQYNQQNTMIDT